MPGEVGVLEPHRLQEVQGLFESRSDQEPAVREQLAKEHLERRCLGFALLPVGLS